MFYLSLVLTLAVPDWDEIPGSIAGQEAGRLMNHAIGRMLASFIKEGMKRSEVEAILGASWGGGGECGMMDEGWPPYDVTVCFRLTHVWPSAGEMPEATVDQIVLHPLWFTEEPNEDLRNIGGDWELIWYVEQASHLTPKDQKRKK